MSNIKDVWGVAGDVLERIKVLSIVAEASEGSDSVQLYEDGTAIAVRAGHLIATGDFDGNRVRLERVVSGLEVPWHLAVRAHGKWLVRGGKTTMGLWRKNGIKGGKYLVQRRDGTVPEWPSFVIGAKDPAATAALLAYADKAERLGYDPRYVSDVRAMAIEFEYYRKEHGDGDPCAPPHRKDDPATVKLMIEGRGA